MLRMCGESGSTGIARAWLARPAGGRARGGTEVVTVPGAHGALGGKPAGTGGRASETSDGQPHFVAPANRRLFLAAMVVRAGTCILRGTAPHPRPPRRAPSRTTDHGLAADRRGAALMSWRAPAAVRPSSAGSMLTAATPAARCRRVWEKKGRWTLGRPREIEGALTGLTLTTPRACRQQAPAHIPAGQFLGSSRLCCIHRRRRASL